MAVHSGVTDEAEGTDEAAMVPMNFIREGPDSIWVMFYQCINCDLWYHQ